MTTGFRMISNQENPMDSQLISQTNYTRERATEANQVFDKAVKRYLRDWIEQGTLSDHERSAEAESDTETFIEQGALRSFFKHRDNALALLLDDEAIANHMLRPIDQVYFDEDAYEPELARFERRIYNLAAHRTDLEIPFRYSPPSRQGAHGDTIPVFAGDDGSFKEDIGMYFGTRRSDTTALTILASKLRRESLQPTTLPIHVITEGYMQESLLTVRQLTEELREEGETQPHCFVIQRRHAADDRHLGAALLIMEPQHPDKPRRIIFCDTLNPSGRPPWWDKFQHKLDVAFPQPEGCARVSDQLEDGGVKLQRLHDGVPVRHQDIDCAFYTFAIVRALIQIAKLTPELLLTGSIEAVVSEMTARMPEYYEQPNEPKEPAVVRQSNVVSRWRVGWEALKNMMRRKVAELTAPELAAWE